MDKITSDSMPGCDVDVLPHPDEVYALEGALLAWHRVVAGRYGQQASCRSWRNACVQVLAFENGE